MSTISQAELLSDIAVRFNIDVNRYIPIKVESNPFFALYCIDTVESQIEGREWVAKFDILPADIDQLAKDFGTSDFDFAISEKYEAIEHDEGNTIDFPDDED
jgi:hypothetical protein